MNKLRTKLVITLITLIAFGCSTASNNPVAEIEMPTTNISSTLGQDTSWGFYELIIEPDQLSVFVMPIRNAEYSKYYGYHVNATKLLEASPCTDCLAVSNVHKLSNGDLSMDVEITHPYDDPRFTGFDVKGIIMFEASQHMPDNEMREQMGLNPLDWGEHFWFSSWEKGDPELMNPDGWTMIWSPAYVPNPLGGETYFGKLFPDYPIFDYYEGKYASELEKVGKLNAYRRFYSKKERHIFEVNKTVSRTYIIRPPADGSPIRAKYAIYAHWWPPNVVPVNNPVTDFPPEANSPIPYEFYITQDAPIDPDKSPSEQSAHIYWHIKVWDIPIDWWWGWVFSLPREKDNGGTFIPHPMGISDTYQAGGFPVSAYTKLPGALPGDMTFIFRIGVRHPTDKPWLDGPYVGTDWYITKIAIEAPDGE